MEYTRLMMQICVYNILRAKRFSILNFESMNRQEQQQQFDAIYQQLNPAQKAAVDALEGPVMVIAGPGTGKTQILSARIGKILLETDARPNNILCLTYTDAGAVAMRKRLCRFIGADAYQVNLYTFHAFCNDIIQDNLSLFQKNALDPISDLERIEYLKELIDRFPKTHPLKRFNHMNTIPAIVTSDEDVVENIINFNKEVLLYNQETQTSAIATLVDNISYYRAWYCLLDSNTNKYLFAPSKYIGLS